MGNNPEMIAGAIADAFRQRQFNVAGRWSQRASGRVATIRMANQINPIAAWDDDDVDRFAFEEDVFLNPLRERGYPSIGCAPCTRPVAKGEDPRAGRWAGKNKTECGLHT